MFVVHEKGLIFIIDVTLCYFLFSPLFWIRTAFTFLAMLARGALWMTILVYLIQTEISYQVISSMLVGH